jgi:hypothetical protein
MIPDCIKIRMLLILILGIVFIPSFAQEDIPDYYFINLQKDTVFCESLSYGTNTKGYLNRLDYITNDNVPYELNGKKNIPNILTFYINGKSLDKIPYRLGSKSKLYVYAERLTDGAIKVYINHLIPDVSVVYRFYVQFEDGLMYRVDKRSDLEEHIKPRMLSCEKFKDALTWEISDDEEKFLETVRLYNSLCE